MAEGYRVRVEPTGLHFDVAPGETVLNAALRQGIPIHYGCRQGNCSSCKYFLDEGEVDFGKASPYALSEAEREDGYALLCCAFPLEDLVVQDRGMDDERALPLLQPETVTATVEEVAPLAGALWRLRLRVAERFAYYPGQFVELEVPGQPGHWRTYSIANASEDATRLEFVLKKIPGGAFSGQVDQLQPGADLPLRGPFGTSYLREGEGPLLLVATGSGLAPLRAMLQDLGLGNTDRPIHFYYGARTRADLPIEEELRKLAARLPGLEYRPCLSQPSAACAWEGRSGRVTQAIQRDIADASPYDAHLCGAPEMCDAVGRLLEAKGIDERNLFFDRFFAAD